MKKDKQDKGKKMVTSLKTKGNISSDLSHGCSSSDGSTYRSHNDYNDKSSRATTVSSIRKQMMAKFAGSFNKDDCVVSTAPTSTHHPKVNGDL